MRKYLILLLALFFFPLGVKAYTFKKYQVNNGLSENSVLAIIQDHRGFMWFGTKDGLNRFDGYEYKVFRNIPGDSLSIGNNFIRSIYQDKEKNLWIGTDSHLYIFDYITEEFQLFSIKSDKGQIIYSGVSAICAENESLIWIGTKDQGAFCYDRKNKKLIQYISNKEDLLALQSNTIRRIYCDYSGSIWLGTREGLSRYNHETNSFFTYTIQNAQGALSNDEILSIYEDSDGDFWLGTWSGGLAKLNKSSNTFDVFLSVKRPPFVSHIRALMEYEKNTLLVGADDGLYLFNKQTGESTRIDNPKDFNSLSDQNTHAIYKDHEGGIWLGTYFGGVNYMSPNANVINHYYPNLSENSLSGKAVSQFCEDDQGNLWVATEDAGINYFNTKTKKFKAYLPSKEKNSLSYHNIHSLLLDGDNLWIGTFSRGIDVMNVKTGAFKNYTYSKTDTATINDICVFSLYKDTRGDIYVGTPYGLSRYNREQDNFTRISEVPAFVYDIKEDHLGTLWIASYSDGAYRFDYKTKTWTNYRHIPNDMKSIVFDKLTCVYLDGKQRLWFASEGRGICKYNYESNDFTAFDDGCGLPNNVVYSILDDKYGNIWLSSNGGISKFNPVTLDIKTYTREDGLQGNQFNYRSGYKSKDGIFYFGGVNGFNEFNPDKLVENTHIPPVAISFFEILSDEKPQKVRIEDRIELKHNQSSFRINFVSLSFQAQEKNNYMYVMEGLDDKWTDIGTQRTVSFINLAPGKYVFRVKNSNNDGVWNEQGTAIEIVIQPPFWKSTIAKIIYLILFLSVVYFIARYYVRKIKWKQQYKLEEFRKEKEREMYDSKIDFFTNVAHEIRTPISLIKAPLECIVNSGDGSLETKENLSVIEKNTDRLLELINQLLDFRKIEEHSYKLKFVQVNINQLLGDISYRFRSAAESRQLTLNTELPNERIYAFVDKDALTKIISNILSNALKYAVNVIDVKLSEVKMPTDTFFEITISDDGVGIEEDMEERIFEPFFQVEENNVTGKKTGTGIGLALARQLVRRHDGDIFINKEGREGGNFVIRIPERLENITFPEENEQEILNIEDSPKVLSDKSTILIVEDNEELRKFLFKNLSQEYHVVIASEGREALVKLEENHIDLIVSDIMMPELDGLELSKIIKQDEQFSHIPIILLSAKTNIQTKVEGLEYGADAYIEKPFSIAYLKAQITSLIENRKKILEKFSRSPIVSYTTIAHTKKDESFLNNLNAVIEQNIANEQFSIEKLATSMSMSQSNLQRKIKGLTGMVPSDYIKVMKLKKSAELLQSGEYRINEVCFLVGFNSSSYFTKCFQKQFNILPKDFMKRGTEK